MKILVTGATGCIGLPLITRLIQEHADVRALVLPDDHQAFALAALGVERIEGDVLDYPAVERAAADCEVIYHLAGKTESCPHSAVIESVNIQGAIHVARAAVRAGVTRLVFGSSGAIYGRTVTNRLITEQTPPRPDSAYSHSKLRAEQILLSQNGADRLAVVVARIGPVLGPGAMSWLNLFQTIASGRFRLIGSGDGHHHVLDVSDVVDGLMRCADVVAAEEQVFVLAGPDPVRLRDLIGLISETVGVPYSAERLPAGPYRLYGTCSDALFAWTGTMLPRADRLDFCFRDRAFDISRSRRELGYAPRISAKEAVQRTAAWFASRGYLP